MFVVDLNVYAENAILLDGFDEAIIGITQEYGVGNRVLYSKNKILDILMKENTMTYSEAEEFFDYNILGGYFGEQNPIFLEIGLIPQKKEDNSFVFVKKLE